MALPNAYKAYSNSKLMTASPAQLTLMLYDGAIKFTNIAIEAIENKNYEKANTYIQKTHRIIDEFPCNPVGKLWNHQLYPGKCQPDHLAVLLSAEGHVKKRKAGSGCVQCLIHAVRSGSKRSI